MDDLNKDVIKKTFNRGGKDLIVKCVSRKNMVGNYGIINISPIVSDDKTDL